ncbi:WD40-repeat-containing domain protein [Tirmania nivea]|nr:WD40-repeat-containing domain protein [Tirmania nivea]
MDQTSPTSSYNDAEDEVMNDVDADAEPYENDSDDSRDKDTDGDEDEDDVDADADADAEGDMDADGENENDGDGDGDDNDDDNPSRSSGGHQPSSSPGPSRPLPALRPGAATASSYDIVPYVAAPHATSINAFCATPCMRWIFTGGNDGYIRKFDWFNSINGKTPLTVAQKHPFVDSVTRAGYTLSYWENEEPTVKSSLLHIPETTDDARLSPVYSLAVHHQALWMLSGLESGGINVQSVRHDEGKIITCLRKHTSAVSVLTLARDEKSLLSGSWDKAVYDWDLNTGQVVREYVGSAGQISTIQFRPTGENTVPVPRTNVLMNGVSWGRGFMNGVKGGTNGMVVNGMSGGGSQEVNGGGVSGPAQAASPAASEKSLNSLFEGDDDDEFSAAVAANGMGNGDGGDAEHHMEDAPPLAPPSSAGTTGEDGAQGTDSADINGAGEAPTNGLDMDTTTALFGDDTLTNPISLDPPTHPNSTANNYPHSPPSRLTSFPTHHLDPSPPSPSSPATHHPPPDPTSPTSNSTSPTNSTTFLTSSIDGTIRIWDRRTPTPIALAYPQKGVPPWCTSATWSTDGNYIYAGRRNCTVEEYSLHKGLAEPTRTLRFPQGSGAVTSVVGMPNGRHLLCASYDNLRLYDLKESMAKEGKHSLVPFLIVPGHHGGVVSSLYVDPSCQFIISTGGNRGWEGSNTEVLLGYEVVPIP